MARILSIATALPPHRADQRTLKQVAGKIFKGDAGLERLTALFDRTGVETRHLVHPPEWYEEERTFDERNDEFIRVGLGLAEKAARECLEKANVNPRQIDHVFFVTTTGLSTPSLDALLSSRLGFRADVRRSPLFGLGCAGGAGALARAADVLRSHLRQRALVVSVELCSLTFSRWARTPADVVGASLFGDGVAAVLLGGDEVATAGTKIVFTRSWLFPQSEDLMGWTFTSDGMRLTLSREIPAFAERELKPLVEQWLLGLAMTLSKIHHFLLHPGGAKVMDAYRRGLGLGDASLQLARDSIRRHGNLSSAAVLFMLHELLSSGQARSGDKGLMLALGPGFAAELLLLSW